MVNANNSKRGTQIDTHSSAYSIIIFLLVLPRRAALGECRLVGHRLGDLLGRDFGRRDDMDYRIDRRNVAADLGAADFVHLPPLARDIVGSPGLAEAGGDHVEPADAADVDPLPNDYVTHADFALFHHPVMGRLPALGDVVAGAAALEAGRAVHGAVRVVACAAAAGAYSGLERGLRGGLNGHRKLLF